MKTGKLEANESMQLPNQAKMRTLGEHGTCKYLGVLEADAVKATEMKKKIRKVYLRTRCSRN